MARKPFIDELKRNLKQAELLISRGNAKRAKFLLKSSVDLYERRVMVGDQGQLDVYVKSLDSYAQLLCDTQAVSPSQIMSEYLEKAVTAIDNCVQDQLQPNDIAQ